MSVSDLIKAFEAIPRLGPVNSELIADLVDVPNWLTHDYIQVALSNFYKDSKLKIVKLSCRPALGRGENYGGVLTRMKVVFTRSNGDTQSGSYILKSSFENDEFTRIIMTPYDIYNREMSIYEQVLPKLKSLLKECDDKEEIFAETMMIDFDRSALMFEDLNSRDFVMPDRLVGLDLKVARLVLRKLAKFHATSAVLNEREGGILEGYDRGMFNRHTDNYAPLYLGMLQAASKRVAQWPGYEQYTEKLEALLPVYLELGKRVFDVSPGINVLAHGDLWTNNILVKYNKLTGEPEDAIIIDFQYAAWGSPAIDVFYFLNSSLQLDYHLHHQEELISCYFEIFSETLRKLNFKAHIPSLHNFHLELKEKLFYAVHTSINIYAIQRNVETENADFKALMETNQRAINFKNDCYTNPITQKVLKALLPKYDSEGLLDANQL